MKIINGICTIILILSIVLFGRYYHNRLKNLDIDGPTIQIDQELLEISIHDSEDVLYQGVTAYDTKDGDVTESIGIENISDFLEDTICQIDYVAFDKDNHVSRASRRIKYVDYTSPVYRLTKPLRFQSSNRNVDILENVYAEDCIDGDISKQIIFSEDSRIYVNVPAEYAVTFIVTNSVGDTQELPVTVTIYDYTEEFRNPRIELTDYLIYVKQGEEINYYDYIESVTYYSKTYTVTDERGTYMVDTSEMSKEERERFAEEEPAVNKDLFDITNQADTSIPGVYEVDYAIDGTDRDRGTMKLVVVVKGE